MSTPFRIAVLASTKGTDLQSIIDAIKFGELHAELACVVSNKKNCFALERARAQGVATHFIDPKNKSREQFDAEMVTLLEKEHIDLVVLVGYMRILTPLFVRAFPKKIINVHPALIPKFCGPAFYGANVHEAVIAAGERETGMTIHYVDEGVDTGEIIMQKKCHILPGDTAEILKERVQALEKEWYPKAIEGIIRDATSKNI